MNLLDLYDDFVGPMNLFGRLDRVVKSLTYANYKRAAKSGAGGVTKEVIGSITGLNATRFALLRSGKYSPRQVDDLLRKYGIPTFGSLHDSRCFYFSVKKRQARWAEYIMLNAGVELANPTFDRRNPGYVGRHGPGWMPTPWAEQERQPKSAPPPDSTSATQPTSSLGRLSRWMDELLED